MIRRAIVSLALAAGVVALGPAPPASAHPLGNFTVNQHSGIVVRPSGVTVDLVVDMAEIPTFQARTDIDVDGDHRVGASEAAAYRQRACASLPEGVELRLDDQPLRPQVLAGELAFPPGQAGLPTLRLTCRLRAALPAGFHEGRLVFTNSNFADRVGWREITATGDGAALSQSDVPARSPSRRLTRYPRDLLSSPLDQRRATMRVVAGASSQSGQVDGSPAASAGDRPTGAIPGGGDRLAAAFTRLVGRSHLTVWFAILALASATALGALHALAPGHGKTVMAAYLVGQRGSLRQAALLGLTVTATHTAGVLVLGLLLSGSAAFVPERVYPWLGVVSGALVAAVGIGLLSRACRRRRGHGAHHVHDHGHDHGDHHHDHHHHAPEAVSCRALAAMGAAGGLVPSPSALVVLLGAIALGRAWFGIALVLAYGAGMALSLVGAGLLLVRARISLETRRARGRPGLVPLLGVLPVVTASFVVLAGLGLTVRAAIRV